jgi:uncharacterized membrane protein YgcG
VLGEDEDGQSNTAASSSSLTTTGSAAAPMPVYVIRGKRWVNTRDFFVEWTSKARSAKKAFHNFVRAHRLCTGSDQQVYMLLTSEDDPYGAWPYIKYTNTSQVMLIVATIATQLVDEFNSASHYSSPPVNRADKGPVTVVDVEALNAEKGGAANKKSKTGHKRSAAKKRALDEVSAQTEREIVLLSLTPQVGPANTPSTVVLMGKHFVQACPVQVVYRVANNEITALAPITALENTMLSCVLPPLPPCTAQVMVVLTRPFSGEAVSSNSVLYHIVEMPPSVAALFANNANNSGGSSNGSSGNNNNNGGTSNNKPQGGSGGGGGGGGGGFPVWNVSAGGFTALHVAVAHGQLQDVERAMLRLRRCRRMGRTLHEVRRNFLRLVQVRPNSCFYLRAI